VVVTPTSPDDSLLTVDGIARILKLNPQTVRNWIDRGFLRAIRIGRRVRVTRAEFDRLIEEGRIGDTRPPDADAARAFWAGELETDADVP
jgi:excisionase family DNA binding protein